MQSEKKHILFIDDDEKIMKFLYRYLKRRNYEAIGALDGDDAIYKASHYQPPVMLIDLQMPGMHGLQLARAIKENPETQGIKIIVISGHVDREMRKALTSLGVEAILEKPFQTDRLLEVIERLLDKESS